MWLGRKLYSFSRNSFHLYSDLSYVYSWCEYLYQSKTFLPVALWYEKSSLHKLKTGFLNVKVYNLGVSAFPGQKKV